MKNNPLVLTTAQLAIITDTLWKANQVRQEEIKETEHLERKKLLEYQIAFTQFVYEVLSAKELKEITLKII